MSEKLQKVLARAGYGSRREIEGWISEGRISVNGSIVQLGERVTEGDVIRIDGKVVSKIRLQNRRTRVLMYHKPIGEITSRSDDEDRITVFENLPRIANGRWIVVGRLDLNTSGLLLFTNDGELANRLMHPSNTVEREYAVRVLGDVSPEVIKKLSTGVVLEDGEAHFSSIRDGGGEGANHWYHVILEEGRNREVRRLWESQGVKVSRLLRVRYGPIAMPRWLKPGRWEYLSDEDVTLLRQSVGLEKQAVRKSPASANNKPPARKTRHGTSQSRRAKNQPR